MSSSIFLRRTETRVEEADTTVFVEIVRTGSTVGEVTVLFSVTPDGATPGLDYLGANGSIVIPDGAQSVSVPIVILDDTLAESTEVVTVALVSATGAGASLVAPRTHRILIIDDETPPPPPPVEPPLDSPYDVARDDRVTGLILPVRFAFSPVDDDIVYVAEKNGVIRVANVETGATSVFLDLSAQVNSAGDRGLLDVALHPDFATTPYVYAFYVADPADTAGQSGNAGPDGGGNRFSYIVRYTADAATGYTSIVAGSAVILVGGAAQDLTDVSGQGALDFTDFAYANETASDRVTQAGDTVINGVKQNFLKADSLSHNGGKLLFGPDGALYVLTGDATSYNYADPRTPDVLSLDTLSGKVLRIDPITGQGLADNPFATADLSSNQSKIFQYGLRNPFSANFDGTGRLFIADVGWFSYEEINTAGPGANFGWPYYEGGDGGVILETPGYRDFAGAASFYSSVGAGTVIVTPAFRAFAHDSGQPGWALQSITSGGVIVEQGPYPEELVGGFVFSDFTNGDVFVVNTLDSTEASYLFDFGGTGPVHMVQGPDGFLYYADIYNGTIGRLSIVPEVPPAPQTFEALGSASVVNPATGEFLLTPLQNFQAGAARNSTRLDIRQDFHISFEVYAGNNEAAADGLAFFLHNDPRGADALGQAGGGLGVRGLANGIALKLDTWENLEFGDAAYDSAALLRTGDFSYLTSQADLGQLEDGRWHSVSVAWNALTQTFSYLVDGTVGGTLSFDIRNGILGGSDYAWFGVTGATGGASADFRVRGIVADVTYEDVAEAQAPVLFGGPLRRVSVDENTADAFLVPVATDAEGGPLTWRVLPGADGALFAVNAATGALRFVAPPDFEAPADGNGDNVYTLTIGVADAGGLEAVQTIEVTVLDVGFEPIRGTRRADFITGTAGNDTIIGGAGNDTLRGGAGNDLFLAEVGDGADSINGGSGTGDMYSARDIAGAVTISLVTGRVTGGGIGVDTLVSIENLEGGSGDDRLTGDAGQNLLIGNDGADTLTGGAGDDVLRGGAGNDRLDGGLGADDMAGGEGDDLYIVDDTEDTVTEAPGGGADTIQSSVDYVLPANIERLVLTGSADISAWGSASDERISGNAGANLLNGGAGADTLEGGAGADTLIGGAGVDRLTGGAGADLFRFLAFSDSPVATPDTITDFTPGLDRIDVSAIDPRPAPGDQAFVFVGGAAFTGGGVAQVRVYASGTNTMVAFDTGNGGAPEMLLRLNGAPVLSAADFIL